MTARKDLPRCKTCTRFDDLDLNADPEIPEDGGECMLTGRWEEPDYGCVNHSDYDEPESDDE